MDEFERHFAACNNARLPGERLPLRIGAGLVGWVRPEMAQELRQFAGVLVAPDAVTLLAEAADGLQDIALALSERGHFRWRREAFDVRAGASGPVLAQLDRGALPAFGVLAHGVHMNGLVRRPNGLHLWVARRSPTKQLDPGKLDHIVAGGVGAGMTPLETLVKEAGEEAAIPPELAAQAVPVGGTGWRTWNGGDEAWCGATSKVEAMEGTLQRKPTRTVNLIFSQRLRWPHGGDGAQGCATMRVRSSARTSSETPKPLAVKKVEPAPP